MINNKSCGACSYELKVTPYVIIKRNSSDKIEVNASKWSKNISNILCDSSIITDKNKISTIKEEAIVEMRWNIF